jgi:putative ABC transport system permease protein
MMKYVRFELSFDRFYPEAKNIYRLSYERYQNGTLAFHSARTMSALAPSIKRDFPEVTEAIRGVYEECLIYIREDNKFLNNQKVFWADHGFLDVFKLKLIEGNPETALREPYSAIISETAARKLYGDKDPMGRTFHHNEGLVFTVTGIFRDIPQNTHLNLEYVYSFITFADWPWGQPEGNWGGNWTYTYILTDDRFDPFVFESDLNARIRTYMPDLAGNKTEVIVHLQPLRNIHLDSKLENEITTNGDRKSLIILIVVALIIFLISWINFINLLTAQFHERTHEVGIRKILGENNLSILAQSLGIILIISIISILLSIVLLKLLDPAFYRVFDIGSSVIRYTGPLFWIIVLGITIAASFVLGVYPSMICYRAKPKNVIAKHQTGSGSKAIVRRVLVIVQFILSSSLIFNMLVLSDQIDFMLSKDLGFTMQNVVLLNAPETWCQTPDSVKSSYVKRFSNKLLQYPEIQCVSACRQAPGTEITGRLNNVGIRGLDQNQENISLQINRVDENYFKALELEYVSGSPFSIDYRNDMNSIIINESAMNALGIQDPESAINRILVSNNNVLQIIAVINDYHHLGVKGDFLPTGYIHRYAYDFGYLLIKTQGNTKYALELIDKTWGEEFPIALSKYRLLEDFYNNQYKPEFRLKNSIFFFTLIAITLAGIGLFSLLKYSLNRRIREISIKRTLGARVETIIQKLLGEFLSMVFSAILIAFVLSYFTANHWLQNFTYRTNIDFKVFVITAGTIIAISILIIVRTVIIAATRNPVIGIREDG